MKRHSWKENTCMNCGVKRKRKTQSLCMAITNQYPYNHYKHETLMAYSFDGNSWTFTRPDCSK